MWSCHSAAFCVATTRSTVATACRLRKAILEKKKEKKKKEAKKKSTLVLNPSFCSFLMTAVRLGDTLDK
jgi:hypothetical protein